MTTTASPTNSAASPPLTQKNAIDDILGLFNTTSITPNPPSSATSPPPSYASSTPTTHSAFSLPQSQSPAPVTSPHPAAAAPRLTSYTAYDKNELKITLTPQTSPTKPGVVMILARFQVSGSSPVTGLNFQAAVPKVRSPCFLFSSFRPF